MWSKIEKVIERIVDRIIPIYFVSSVFANVLSFYLSGNVNETARKIISWGFLLVIFLLMQIKIGIIFKRNKHEKKKFLLIGMPILANFILILIAIFHTQFQSYAIKEMVLFILYCTPMYGVALCIIIEDKVKVFFRNFKWIGVLFIPFFLLSIVMFIRNMHVGIVSSIIGGMTYLEIAYAAIIIVIFNMADMINDTKLSNEVHFKKNRIINIANILISTVVIVLSGSRGCFIALGVWAICILLMSLNKKYRNKNVISTVLAVMIVSIIVFAFQEGGRTKAFINEIFHGGLNTAIKSDGSDQMIDRMYDEANNGQAIKDTITKIQTEIQIEDQTEIQTEAQTEVLTETQTEAQTETQTEVQTESVTEITVVTQPEENISQEEIIYSITNGSMARIYLYKLAIKEANNNPLIGMGPLGFQQKYGTYPHNLILESLSDLGYPITIIFLFFILYLVIYLVKVSKDRICDLSILIIGITQAVRMMLSIDLYVEPFMIWIIIYILAIKVIRSGKKENMILEE